MLDDGASYLVVACLCKGKTYNRSKKKNQTNQTLIFVKQSEKKMSQMLVIAKKFKEILKPEHRNTVWKCPKEYLLATVKTVRKCVKPKGRSPRTNIKS